MKKKIMKMTKGKKVSTVKEVDYKEDDIVDIPIDVYNLTIAAHITGACSP